MKNEITISYNSEETIQELKYRVDCNTKVIDLLKYLYYEIEKNLFVNDEYEQTELLGCFSFKKDFHQKADLEYPILKFLNNFGYDLNNVQIIYDPAYGIGAYCEFEEIAKIRIYGDEPKHINRPHVHICEIGKKDKGISVSLTTFEPFNGCEKEWNQKYSKKEQEELIHFLKENKEKLVDFYNRCTKGEYITEDYILAYNGKTYKFFEGRTF